MRIVLVVLVLSFATPAFAQEARLAELTSRAASGDGQALIDLGIAQRRAGRFDEALATMRRAVRARGVVPERAQFELARVYFDKGDYRGARNVCNTVLRITKRGVLGHDCMGLTYLVWRRSSRAAEEFDQSLAADPNDVIALYGKAEGSRMLSATAEAEGLYRRAIAAGPNEYLPHLGLGILYLDTNRAREAVQELRRAAELAPDEPEPQLRLGKALGRGADAITALERAVAIRPRWAEAQIELGSALLASNQAQAALTRFQEALRLEATSGSAQEGLGLALFAVGGQDEAAEAALKRALELVPNLPRAVFTIAEIQARTNRVDEAAETFRQAADLMRGDPTPLMRAGEVLRDRGRHTVAIGFFQRALAINPNLARAHLALGDVYWSRHDWPRAKASYEAALRSGLTGPDATRVRERVTQLRTL